MVRLENLRRGVIQKCQYLWNHQSNLLHFWTQYTLGGALPLGGIVLQQYVTGVCTGAQNISGVHFLVEKQR